MCPVLGKRYPKLMDGVCPTQLQSPIGKHIPITYIGTPPYILGAGADGTDVRAINMLAEKHKFKPILTPTPQYLIMTFENGTKYGKKYQVCFIVCTRVTIADRVCRTQPHTFF